MPKLFHVTFIKQWDATIIAESEEELREALDNHSGYDFDDWSDSDWETLITDLFDHSNPDAIPTSVKPDMGVHEGECLNIADYAKDHPDFQEKLEEAAKERIRKLTVEKLNLKLPL